MRLGSGDLTQTLVFKTWATPGRVLGSASDTPRVVRGDWLFYLLWLVLHERGGVFILGNSWHASVARTHLSNAPLSHPRHVVDVLRRHRSCRVLVRRQAQRGVAGVWRILPFNGQLMSNKTGVPGVAVAGCLLIGLSRPPRPVIRPLATRTAIISSWLIDTPSTTMTSLLIAAMSEAVPSAWMPCACATFPWSPQAMTLLSVHDAHPDSQWRSSYADPGHIRVKDCQCREGTRCIWRSYRQALL